MARPILRAKALLTRTKILAKRLFRVGQAKNQAKQQPLEEPKDQPLKPPKPTQLLDLPPEILVKILAYVLPPEAKHSFDENAFDLFCNDRYKCNASVLYTCRMLYRCGLTATRSTATLKMGMALHGYYRGRRYYCGDGTHPHELCVVPFLMDARMYDSFIFHGLCSMSSTHRLYDKARSMNWRNYFSYLPRNIHTFPEHIRCIRLSIGFHWLFDMHIPNSYYSTEDVPHLHDRNKKQQPCPFNHEKRSCLKKAFNNLHLLLINVLSPTQVRLESTFYSWRLLPREYGWLLGHTIRRFRLLGKEGVNVTLVLADCMHHSSRGKNERLTFKSDGTYWRERIPRDVFR